MKEKSVGKRSRYFGVFEILLHQRSTEKGNSRERHKGILFKGLISVFVTLLGDFSHSMSISVYFSKVCLNRTH